LGENSLRGHQKELGVATTPKDLFLKSLSISQYFNAKTCQSTIFTHCCHLTSHQNINGSFKFLNYCSNLQPNLARPSCKCQPTYLTKAKKTLMTIKFFLCASVYKLVDIENQCIK